VSTIERFRVEGFRSIRQADVKLGPMTALIGANGAGKSNFALALSLLSYLESGSLGRFVADHGGAGSLLHRGRKVSPAMTIDLVLRDAEGLLGYRAVLRSAAGDKLSVGEEAVAELSAEGDGPWISLTSNTFESSLAAAPAKGGPASRVRLLLQRCKHLHVHDTSESSHLRGLARIEDGGYLRSNGSNLAAYLFKLRGDESEAGRAAWQRILELVQRVAPFIKELRPTPVRASGGDEPPASGPVRLDWVDELDDVYSVEHLSDGTLRAIAIITMLAQPPSALPYLLVIDEPELGLHPLALALVCELSRSVSSRCQIILATQAPAVLDHVRPEEILVADREDGATRLRNLDPAELQQRLEALGVGR
jgi:predicted ATPase